MKVLLNVAPGLLEEHRRWQPCEGVKFVEQPDGSFDLLFTRDLEEAWAEDRPRLPEPGQ